MGRNIVLVSDKTGRQVRIKNIYSRWSRDLGEILEGEAYASEVARDGYGLEEVEYPWETVVSVYGCKLSSALEKGVWSMMQLDVIVFQDEESRRVYVEDGMRCYNAKMLK